MGKLIDMYKRNRDVVNAFASHAKLWTFCMCLVGFGAILGAMYASKQCETRFAAQKAEYADMLTLQRKDSDAEIARLQNLSTSLIARVPPLVNQVTEITDKMGQAADLTMRASKTANDAANVARSAATSAANANIRPGPLPSPAEQDRRGREIRRKDEQ